MPFLFYPHPRIANFSICKRSRYRIICWPGASSLRFHIAIISRYSQLFYFDNRIVSTIKYAKFIGMVDVLFVFSHIHTIRSRHKLLLHFTKYWVAGSTTILFITCNDVLSQNLRELHNNMRVRRYSRI